MSDTIQSAIDECDMCDWGQDGRCHEVKRNCPRKTIQSAEALAFDIAAFDPGSYSVKEMIIPLINSRDAAIRADEARKQADRYAAIIKELKTLLAICDPVNGKSLSDIYKPDSNGCIFCSNNKVCGYLTDNDALADLEAPK
jgi:Cys-tRNA synthase (O-phospho-L-seryl-tRNA:Cys-tRNA synthase)